MQTTTTTRNFISLAAAARIVADSVERTQAYQFAVQQAQVWGEFEVADFVLRIEIDGDQIRYAVWDAIESYGTSSLVRIVRAVAQGLASAK